jgi:hypothetical protein
MHVAHSHSAFPTTSIKADRAPVSCILPGSQGPIRTHLHRLAPAYGASVRYDRRDAAEEDGCWERAPFLGNLEGTKYFALRWQDPEAAIQPLRFSTAFEVVLDGPTFRHRGCVRPRSMAHERHTPRALHGQATNHPAPRVWLFI